MTFATGVIIANNYYAQPLEAAIADAFDAPSSAVGAVLTLIQLSYALGLATLVPLGDLLERRRLTVLMLSVVVLGQVVVAVAPRLAVLAAAAALVALMTVAAQVLVPFAAHLAPEGEQGKVISTVMSGLLIGVLLSRVVAGLVSELVGWRAVFVLGALLTAVAAGAALADAAGAGPGRPDELSGAAALGAGAGPRGAGAALADGLQRVLLRRFRRGLDQHRVPAGRAAVPSSPTR